MESQDETVQNQSLVHDLYRFDILINNRFEDFFDIEEEIDDTTLLPCHGEKLDKDEKMDYNKSR